MKQLTLSLIIPTYNEQHHLKACLDAIARQTLMPAEVIVVDNNSTDNTVAIAKSFSFVRVIHESKQGHAPPRNRGFNAAQSDVIARIDADSILDNNWVARVLQDFSNPNIAGVTGLGRTDVLPRIHRPKWTTTFWCRLYYWAVHPYFNTVTTWGANMAIRKDWWQRVKRHVRDDDNITHEDQDVSLLIAGEGGRIIQDNQLLITIRGQSYLYFPKLVDYARLRTLTKRHHQALGTFKRPTMIRLGFWQTLPLRLLIILPGLCFIMVSFMLWPLDAFMLHVMHKPQWLD